MGRGGEETGEVREWVCEGGFAKVGFGGRRLRGEVEIEGEAGGRKEVERVSERWWSGTSTASSRSVLLPS